MKRTNWKLHVTFITFLRFINSQCHVLTKGILKQALSLHVIFIITNIVGQKVHGQKWFFFPIICSIIVFLAILDKIQEPVDCQLTRYIPLNFNSSIIPTDIENNYICIWLNNIHSCMCYKKNHNDNMIKKTYSDRFMRKVGSRKLLVGVVYTWVG